MFRLIVLGHYGAYCKYRYSTFKCHARTVIQDPLTFFSFNYWLNVHICVRESTVLYCVVLRFVLMKLRFVSQKVKICRQ
jgi:hypothetical protein